MDTDDMNVGLKLRIQKKNQLAIIIFRNARRNHFNQLHLLHWPIDIDCKTHYEMYTCIQIFFPFHPFLFLHQIFKLANFEGEKNDTD